MLTARKLLIPGSATTAKKASLPNPLYVYCTKMLVALSPADPHSDHSIPQILPCWIEKKHSHCPQKAKTPPFKLLPPPPRALWGWCVWEPGLPLVFFFFFRPPPRF